jgi:hypothetical protein
MKKSLAITTVSLLAFVASAGTAKADYPPLQDVKPSTVVPEISYDRTPATPNADARRIVSPVPTGTTQTVSVFLGESFTPVIPNVAPGQRFTVRITTADGKTITLPSVRAIGNGNLRLPTLSLSKGGTYTVKVTAANGRVRTLKIRVAR